MVRGRVLNHNQLSLPSHDQFHSCLRVRLQISPLRPARTQATNVLSLLVTKMILAVVGIYRENLFDRHDTVDSRRLSQLGRRCLFRDRSLQLQ